MKASSSDGKGSVSRGMKRQEVSNDGDKSKKSKKSKAEATGYKAPLIATAGEHCEGSGIVASHVTTRRIRHSTDAEVE